MTSEVFLTNVLHVVFSLGLIAYVAPYFLIALVPLLVIFFLIFRVFTATVRTIKREDMISRAPLISHITASVQGIATIHAYRKEKDFIKQ
jgi:ABC-type bacteriocin/lantibiotic exporter with double-glycine peptidase domain